MGEIVDAGGVKRGKVEARGKWVGGMVGSKSHAKRHSFFSDCELSGNVSLIKCDMDTGGTGLAVHAMAGWLRTCLESYVH